MRITNEKLTSTIEGRIQSCWEVRKERRLLGGDGKGNLDQESS